MFKLLFDVHQCSPVFFLLNIVYFSVCLTSNKLYWIDDQLADVSTRFYMSASWRRRVGPSASWLVTDLYTPWSLGLQLSCSSHSNLRKLTKFIEVVLLFTKFTPFLTQFHMQSQTIRRSEVQFFMGTQNFFFVPRFWQDEKTSFHNEEVTSIFLIGNNKMKIKIYKLILLNFLDHDAFNCILLISFRQ